MWWHYTHDIFTQKGSVDFLCTAAYPSTSYPITWNWALFFPLLESRRVLGNLLHCKNNTERFTVLNATRVFRATLPMLYLHLTIIWIWVWHSFNYVMCLPRVNIARRCNVIHGYKDISRVDDRDGWSNAVTEAHLHGVSSARVITPKFSFHFSLSTFIFSPTHKDYEMYF